MLLLSSSAQGSGRVATWFDKLGGMMASKSSGLVSKAAGLFTVGAIACTLMSCDTKAVIKVKETVYTETEVRVDYSYQQMYYVIDGIAWPYHAVVVDSGYPEVINHDCNYVPMETMQSTYVPDHEFVGADVAYTSPAPDDYIDPLLQLWQDKKILRQWVL